jgi:cephalosporin-C deacetylase-like acetyl esterase
VRTIRQFWLSLLLLFYFSAASWARGIGLNQSHENGIYKKGDRIRVTLFLNGSPDDSLSVRIWENFSKEVIQKKIWYTGDTVVIYDKAFRTKGSVIFEVATKSERVSIGSIVEPGKFTPGTKRPNDFNKFWKGEKRKLKDLPMDVKAVPLKQTEKGYLCTDVEINCTGPKPARGYFARPESAKPKSLPIVLYLHAAGVNGSWCRSEPGNAMRYARMGKGALGFDLNAHGMLNGQPDSYYDNLEKIVLKNYALTGLENKNDIYFRGMYLRLIRTLDFLTQQPEWDGKRILVIGDSQGGGQALAAAGLDSRVSAVVATVPAMCDWGGTLAGRKGGWPNPYASQNNKELMLSTLPYFDAAHLLKNSKATLVVEIGLIDTTCPASGVFAAINRAGGKKIVYSVPYRAHQMAQPAYSEIWDKTVKIPKAAYIQRYLK